MSKSGGVLKSAAYKLSEKNIRNKFCPQNGGARSHFVLKCRIKSNFQNLFTFCKLAVFIIKFGVGIFFTSRGRSSAQYGQNYVKHLGSTT